MEQRNKREVRVFALASFLQDFGSDIIYPIWPLFVTVILGANMAALGFIDGLGDAIVSISQAISGYASDRMRRRKVFIWTGYLFGALSRVGYAFSTIWQQLIPFRILDRAGKIRGAPRDAIIADISTRENRGGNFGFLRAMDNLGAVCGIVTSILLLELVGYRNLFLLATIPSAMAVFLILFAVKERKPADTRIFKGFSLRSLDRNLKLFLLLSAIFALGSFSYSFLLMYAKAFGFQTALVPVLYLIFTAVAALFSLPFGRLADRIGRKSVLLLAYLFWGLVCVSFIFIQSYVAVALTFVVYGLHKGALEPVQKSLVSELAPKERRASILGAFQMVIGLSALPASLIAGILWDRIDMFVPFYFSLVLTILSAILLLFISEK